MATRCTDPLTLIPDATSVRAARQHVARALIEAGRVDWVDDATLAVSEIVTNVVLHAHTSCELTVDVRSDCVRVDVRDFNLAIPGQRNYSQDATTGRGPERENKADGAHAERAVMPSDGPAARVVAGQGRSSR